ncbi:MAG: hypothetical protein AAB229_10115 [Candidatus Hydrogenedentota bacterium]
MSGNPISGSQASTPQVAMPQAAAPQVAAPQAAASQAISSGSGAPAQARATQSPVSRKKLCALKGVFAGDYSGVRGTFLILMDLDSQSQHRLHVIIASEKGEFRFQIKQEWKAFEDAIIRAKLQGMVAHQLSMEIQSYVSRMMSEDAGISISENIKTGHPEEIRRVLIEIFSRAIADADILMEVEVEHVEEVVEDTSQQAAAPVEEQPAGETQKFVMQEVVLRVEPILSPVLGIAAKELKPGMNIIVEIKEQSSLKQNISKLLSVRGSGEKPTAVGTVVDVSPGVHDRITIRVNLAPNVVGITNIFGDLRVKVPEVQAARAISAISSGAADGPREPMALSTPAFILATLGIFTIMLILAYLIFGGVV